MVGGFDRCCRLSGTAIAAASKITGAAIDGEVVGNLKMLMNAFALTIWSSRNNLSRASVSSDHLQVKSFVYITGIFPHISTKTLFIALFNLYSWDHLALTMYGFRARQQADNALESVQPTLRVFSSLEQVPSYDGRRAGLS